MTNSDLPATAAGDGLWPADAMEGDNARAKLMDLVRVDLARRAFFEGDDVLPPSCNMAIPASEARRCVETTIPLAASTAGREASFAVRGESSTTPSKHVSTINANRSMLTTIARDAAAHFRCASRAAIEMSAAIASPCRPRSAPPWCIRQCGPQL